MAKKPPADKEGWLRKVDLAPALGITRPTLDKFLFRPDAPKPDSEQRYEVELCAAYIAKAELEKQSSGKNYWEAQKARLHCQEIEHRIARERGEFISKAEASKTIIPIMAELGALLKQKFELELPSRYQGKDRIECAQMNAEAIDYISRRFRSGVKDLLVESA